MTLITKKKPWNSCVEANSSLCSYLSYLSCCIWLSVLPHFHWQSVLTSLKGSRGNRRQEWIITFCDKDWADTQICNSHPLYHTVFFNAQHPSQHTRIRWRGYKSSKVVLCSNISHQAPGNSSALWPQGKGWKLTHTPLPCKEEQCRQCCRSSETGSNISPGRGTEQSSSSGYELSTKTGFIQQPQTDCTNMQASDHCNFLANLFLSKRSENNQEVVQKNTGNSSHVPMVKPVHGKHYKKKYNFCGRNLFKDLLTFRAKIFLFFFSSSEPWWDWALVSLLCWWIFKIKEKIEKYYIKILNVWKQHLGYKKTHCSYFVCLDFLFCF